MACNRGCTGVNINNATNICGLQIQQDCSPGCTGLASGQSRLLIDINGDLVVCSNVGGVCTCNSVAGFTNPTAQRQTNATTANGNLIQFDLDGDGSIDFEFCEGFCELDIVNDCISGGVGADYAVKTFSLNGDILTVNSAPEHTSVSYQDGPTTDPNGPGNPSTVINDQVLLLSSTIAVTNPSTCRDMMVMVTGIGTNSLVTPSAGGYYRAKYRLDSDVAGQNIAVSQHRYISPMPAGTDIIGSTGSVSFTEILAPGATIIYTFNILLLSDTIGFPVVSTINTISMSIVGSTV